LGLSTRLNKRNACADGREACECFVLILMGLMAQAAKQDLSLRAMRLPPSPTQHHSIPARPARSEANVAWTQSNRSHLIANI
jgi:hypothetical protein